MFLVGICVGTVVAFVVAYVLTRGRFQRHVDEVRFLQKSVERLQKMCDAGGSREEALRMSLTETERRYGEAVDAHSKANILWNSSQTKYKRAATSDADALRTALESLGAATKQGHELRVIISAMKKENIEIAHELEAERQRLTQSDRTWRESVLRLRKDLDKQTMTHSCITSALVSALRTVAGNTLHVTEYLASLRGHGFEAPLRIHALRGTVRWHILQALSKSPLEWSPDGDEMLSHVLDDLVPMLRVKEFNQT